MNLLETRGPQHFGDWTVTQVIESEVEAFPYDVLFPGASLEEVIQASPKGVHRRLTDSGNVIMTVQFFVLRRDDLVILIEQGSGNDKARPGEPYWDHQNLPYLQTLASLGIQPDDVSYVAFTHLHVDHVGLATTLRDGRWVPTFPNAKYLVHPEDWNVYGSLPCTDPRWHPCIDDSARPLVETNAVQWVVEGDCVAGLRVHEAPGHSPGNILYELDGHNLWFAGDLFHHPAQVARPDWPSAAYDFDREMNTRQRKRYLKLFASTGATVFTVHQSEPFKVIETRPGEFQPSY